MHPDSKSDDRMVCPCCGYKTISDTYEICDICFWEYDPVQSDDPDCTGANRITLREAQRNFQHFGAAEFNCIDSVRPPEPGERREADWHPLDCIWPSLTCPCCGYKTISDSYEICEICAWEYDPHSQNIHPDEGGGPNPMSLREAQANFMRIGAKGELYLDMVRPASEYDVKDLGWKPV